MANRKRTQKYEPTEEHRRMVSQLATLGISHDIIGSILGISDRTLEKYYPKELKESLVKANAKMMTALYQMGINGNVAAAIFWMKTKGGWRTTDAVDQPRTINLPRPQFTLSSEPETIDVTPAKTGTNDSE